MRKKKLIRMRVARTKRGSLDIDITSLLDILVILLVFLLKSYNSSGLVFNIEDNIKLPQSRSSTVNTAGIIVQVSPTSILVDDKLILDSSNLPPNVFDGPGNKRIIPLFDSLTLKREEVKQINQALPEPQPFSGVVNFVIDKTIGYNYIKKLMYTAGEAGFFKFNFVVLGEES